MTSRASDGGVVSDIRSIDARGGSPSTVLVEDVQAFDVGPTPGAGD